MKDKVDCGARPFGVEAAEANKGRLSTVDFLDQNHSQLHTIVTIQYLVLIRLFLNVTIVRHVAYQGTSIAILLHIIVPLGSELTRAKTYMTSH